MKLSIRKGFSFGLTSGIITTLGLIVGLYSGTHSKLAIFGAILIIAVADALSDAFGIHVSEESERKHTSKEVWESTFSTFLSKFIFALTFVIPILLFELSLAIAVSVVWGLFLISILSYKMAKKNKWKAVSEHLIIAVIVIIIANYVGKFVSYIFGTV